MTEELKNCPFCGGKAELKRSSLTCTFYDVYIDCFDCKSSSPRFSVDEYDDKTKIKAKEDAMKAWNTRAKDE